MCCLSVMCLLRLERNACAGFSIFILLTMAKKKYLSVDEKRSWLADIFRDASGEYSQADKFKAMIEDTRLAMLAEEKAKPAQQATLPGIPAELLSHLPPPLTSVQQEAPPLLGAACGDS